MVILIIIRVLNFGQIGVILYKYNETKYFCLFRLKNLCKDIF